MDWLCVSIYTTADGIEPLSGRLYNLGITGMEIEDKDDFINFLENNRQYWDYVDDELMRQKEKESCIKVYISDNEEGHEQLVNIQNDLSILKGLDTEHKFGRLEISIDSINEENWANNWKQYFKPIEVGEKIIIKPEWEELGDTKGKIVFNIDPGMSFGSGQHETTQLCVKELEKLIKKDMTVLDLGCGSGILSIISLLLGAKNAYAIDIDPNAVKIAYSNAKLNNFDDSVYTVKAGNILVDDNLKDEIAKNKYDIVVANIVADVIILLSNDVKRYMNDNATFICSGIIDGRVEEVKKALSDNNFDILDIKKDGDWYCIVSKVREDA